MEELIVVMKEIRDLLEGIDSKLNDIRGSGLNSIDDICNKLDDIHGDGYRSISDICDKIDEISVNGTYSVKDVCERIDDVERAVNNVESAVDRSSL